jgi:hypothetical protein
MRSVSQKLTVLLTMSVGVLSACKSVNNDVSDGKSLDNFARKQGIAITQNSCDGSITGGFTGQHKDYFDQWFTDSQVQSKDSLIQIGADGGSSADAAIIEGALKKALTSVPLNLQLVFFGLKNRIVVNEISNEICKGEFPGLQPHARIFASEGNLNPADFDTSASAKITDDSVKVNSCWIFNDAKQRVEIHINNDITTNANGVKTAAAVEHSTVRIFAYVLSQIAAHANLKGAQTRDVFGAVDAKTYMPDKFGINFAKNDDFMKAMIQLEQDVTADVDGSNGKYDLSFYRGMLANSQTRDSFKHYLFADSFDSFYCSSATRAVMQKDFPKSFSTFEQVATSLENMKYDGDVKTGSIDAHGTALTVIGVSSVYNQVQIARIFGWVGGLFRGFFQVAYSIARFAYGVVQAVAHTAVQIVRGAIYVAGQIVRGAVVLVGQAVRAVGQVALATARLGGHLLRGVGYLTLGTINFVRHVLIGKDYYSVLPDDF